MPANRLCPPLSGFISGKGHGLTENQGMHTGRDNAKVGAVGRMRQGETPSARHTKVEVLVTELWVAVSAILVAKPQN
ncbi:hypothetical protein CX648_00745 [Aeromonas dhakensis]|nr:hypothetical protein CX648_00745 [Aeromonas dhakensis]